MRVFLSFVILCLILVVQFIYAHFMKMAAIRKGYGADAHVWALCFWLGIVGGIYVIALPDLIQQSQNQRMIELLQGSAEKQV